MKKTLLDTVTTISSLVAIHMDYIYLKMIIAKS